MAEYETTMANIAFVLSQIKIEVENDGEVIVTTKSPSTGKWGMARLWYSWMSTTATYMQSRGVTMPLYIKPDGSVYGSRPFNEKDAHDLFTSQWLGLNAKGERLSWAKSKGLDGDRVAGKGERFYAMLKHQAWALEKGFMLMKPRGSEFSKLEEEHGG